MKDAVKEFLEGITPSKPQVYAKSNRSRVYYDPHDRNRIVGLSETHDGTPHQRTAELFGDDAQQK